MDSTAKTSPIAEEIGRAARLLNDLRIELMVAEHRLGKLQARAMKGGDMRPVVMILRANADRVSDRCVALHDIARRIADIMAAAGES